MLETWAKEELEEVGSGTTTCWLSPIRTSTKSPSFRLDLSISDFNVNTEPAIESTSNLVLVL